MASSIEFYYMPESPPCRAVEMVASLVGVSLNKHYINLFTKEHLKDDYVKINPLHKVPFIVDGDVKMGESRAILMYLVNKYKPNDEHLYPKDPAKRAQVDELLFYDIGTLFAAQSKLLRPKIFGPVKELNGDDEKAYRECLHYLDKRLGESGGKGYMLGDHFTIADVSLAATFTFAAACEYDLSEFKNLVAYLERMKSAIPNYGAINDKPVETMTKFIRSRQEAS
uniref:Glutathione S-transferase 1, isoform C n=1 Tax=Aceria tosichella TaxID=561515 RepID=A0A6G1SG98_9ACAR